MRGALLVCGTTSDAGKSTFVTGLCRLLARRGVSVAPFKAQNMANNSWVTLDGGEIGRSTAAQALAAGIEPDVEMNPILLKPSGARRSQLIVSGRPDRHLEAADHHERVEALHPIVHESLSSLRRRFDVVICEGAGSPAEINLLDRDLVNLPLARDAGMAALIVGDIERGGVFASLYGTVELLPPDLRAVVGGFVINRFRGDLALLEPGPAMLAERCGVPTIGVVPHLGALAVDGEDTLVLDRFGSGTVSSSRSAALDVAVVALPHISNFTDVDALAVEPGVGLRLVARADHLGRPDLVVLPGTKSTVADLDWLRATGLDRALRDAESDGATVLGICGGYQMLGRAIDDRVESGRGTVAGLGVLDVETVFAEDKLVERCSGRALGAPLDGYRIHHGRVSGGGATPWIELDRSGAEGGRCGGWWGTTVHGCLDGDEVRAAFLAGVAQRSGRGWQPSGVRFAAVRARQADQVADAIEEHVDLTRLVELIEAAGDALSP